MFKTIKGLNNSSKEMLTFNDFRSSFYMADNMDQPF